MAERSPVPARSRHKSAAAHGLIFLLIVSAAGCADESTASPAALSLPIIATLPHDPEAYTQGLLYHEGSLYESTGRRGFSSLRKLDASTGEILTRQALDPRYFGEGLALLNGRLYQLTWQERTAFVYDVATMELLGALPLLTDGWGLTTDGTHLIYTDGTYLLRYVDPQDFRVVKTVEVTYDGRVVTALNELEWIRGEIWANIYLEDRIARIDPVTGSVRGWVSTEGLISWFDKQRGAEVANGIAYDSLTDRLWLTGKNWPRIYQVERPD